LFKPFHEKKRKKNLENISMAACARIAAAAKSHLLPLWDGSLLQHFVRDKEMSGRSRRGGGGVKRQRKKEEEDLPSSLQVTAHAEPLTLLAVVKSNFDMLVRAQLCNSQGVSMFSFVLLPPRVRRPFAGAPVYGMSLTHAERLFAVGCGFKGKLVRLLSLGVDRYFEPQRNWGACRKMMQSNVRRVVAGLVAAVRDKVATEAEELCASGQCAAAVAPLHRAIYLGDCFSLALKAWLLVTGREGVAKDHKTAFELAEEGVRLGCRHCQGVVSFCYWYGYGCRRDEARSLEFARESSGRGSRYGQVTLGELHHWGGGGLAHSYARALAFYRLAAAQGLDAAQNELGRMYLYGSGVVRHYAVALRWFHLAAAQGHPHALYMVAECHQRGDGVAVAADVTEAIRWYRRANAAGHPGAARELRRLRELQRLRD